MSAFIAANAAWLRVCQLPSYAPDLTPVEDIWPLLARGALANLVVGNIDELAVAARHELKALQYRPDTLGGYLTEAGLQPPTGNTTH